MDQPLISVVICTRNRAAVLAETLRHLEGCRIPVDTTVEFILVDNNSSDGTRQVIEDFVRRSSVRAIYVFEGRQEVAAARNTGCRTARGDIIAMIDDDVIPHEQFLKQLHDEFARAQVLCIIGGRVELWNALHAAVTIDLLPDSWTALSWKIPV